ncbi:MAG: hypothetical protein ACI4J5_03225 [Oscillospiraceae bacterium]
MESLLYIILLVFSCGWAWLLVHTYKNMTSNGLFIHTIVFIFLSLLVAWGALKLIFLPADDTYSASNLGALGVIFFIFLQFFAPACLIAFLITLGKMLGNREDDDRDDDGLSQ